MQAADRFYDYTVRISAEPSYYGSECSKEDADRIAENLSDLIRGEFPGIRIEPFIDGQGSSSTTGPDDVVVEQINQWIENNWTAAL
jgi:hypothetical protein